MKLILVNDRGLVCNHKYIHLLTSIVEEHIPYIQQLCIIYIMNCSELSSLHIMDLEEHIQFNNLDIGTERDYIESNVQIANYLTILIYNYYNLDHINIDHLELLDHNHPDKLCIMFNWYKFCKIKGKVNKISSQPNWNMPPSRVCK